jgi:hypothetical protein
MSYNVLGKEVRHLSYKNKTLTDSDLKIIESHSKKNLSDINLEADNSQSFGFGDESDNKKGK